MTTSDSSPILAGTAPSDTDADAAPPVIALLAWTATADTLTVTISGKVDHFSAATLRPILASALAGGCIHLILDTSGVSFADSALLSLLAPWHGTGRSLTLCDPSTAVRRLTQVIAAAARLHTGPVRALPRVRATAPGEVAL